MNTPALHVLEFLEIVNIYQGPIAHAVPIVVINKSSSVLLLMQSYLAGKYSLIS